MNIILIMSDSLRPDCVGAYGKHKVETPNIDRLAKRSFLFENATAECPITIPARTAIATGKYTFTNRYWSPLRKTDLTLPEVLRQNGYRTAIIGDKHIGELLREIENLDLFDDSLIVYLSDHGEPLGEHNIMRKLAKCLYDELVRIVLFIKPPGVIAPRRIGSPASNIDIFPTLLEIAKIPLTPDIQGKSLVPSLASNLTQGNSLAFSGYYHENRNPRLGEFSISMRE